MGQLMKFISLILFQPVFSQSKEKSIKDQEELLDRYLENMQNKSTAVVESSGLKTLNARTGELFLCIVNEQQRYTFPSAPLLNFSLLEITCIC